MNVISLFDGMATGLYVLKKLGLKVDKYYSSEIDKYSSAVARYKFPEIIELGDITLSYFWQISEPIDLMLGGFPCQNFSLAGNLSGFNGSSGSLFYNLVDTFKMFKPKYFLFENVVMKKEYQDKISNILGVEPIMINSRVVSAQNRKRLYWTNLKELVRPVDRNISLKDILLNNEKYICASRGRYLPNGKTRQKVEIRDDEKSNTLTTVGKDNMVLVKRRPHGFDNGKNAYSDKSDTLRTSTNTNYKIHDGHILRSLTPIECERLQTMPDDYTEYGIIDGKIKKISNSQRFKMLGNGWTAEIIGHILKNLNKAK